MTTVSWLLPSFGEDTSRSASQLKVIFAIARRASCLSYRTNKPVALERAPRAQDMRWVSGRKANVPLPDGLAACFTFAHVADRLHVVEKTPRGRVLRLGRSQWDTC